MNNVFLVLHNCYALLCSQSILNILISLLAERWDYVEYVQISTAVFCQYCFTRPFGPKYYTIWIMFFTIIVFSHKLWVVRRQRRFVNCKKSKVEDIAWYITVTWRLEINTKPNFELFSRTVVHFLVLIDPEIETPGHEFIYTISTKERSLSRFPDIAILAKFWGFSHRNYNFVRF